MPFHMPAYRFDHAMNSYPCVVVAALLALLLANSVHSVHAQGVGQDKASNLTALGCTGSQTVTCNAPWVYCIDAECDVNVEGKVATCRCWKQASGESVAPNGQGGAPCVLSALGLKNESSGQDYANGQELCQALEGGSLISTFGKDFRNTSYIPEFSYEYCDARTPFAYCFGAPCVQDPDNEEYAICSCPYVHSDSDLNQTLTVQKKQCAEGKEKICTGVFNDDPIDSRGEAVYDIAKVVDSCDTVRGKGMSPDMSSSAASVVSCLHSMLAALVTIMMTVTLF